MKSKPIYICNLPKFERLIEARNVEALNIPKKYSMPGNLMEM